MPNKINPTPVLLPWTEEPGGLQSMGSLRVGHDWATSLSLFTFMHWRRRWQPTPVFLPGESQGCGSLVGCRLWGCIELDTLKRLSNSSSKSTPKVVVRILLSKGLWAGPRWQWIPQKSLLLFLFRIHDTCSSHHDLISLIFMSLFMHFHTQY